MIIQQQTGGLEALVHLWVVVTVAVIAAGFQPTSLHHLVKVDCVQAATVQWFEDQHLFADQGGPALELLLHLHLESRAALLSCALRPSGGTCHLLLVLSWDAALSCLALSLEQFI